MWGTAGLEPWMEHIGNEPLNAGLGTGLIQVKSTVDNMLRGLRAVWATK